MTRRTSGRSPSHVASASPCRSASRSRRSIVRRPLSARNTSSGPAGIPISSVLRCSRSNHSSLAETRPSRRSECPERYLVPASRAMSTPCVWGEKNSGVAQVLSNMTHAPRAWATSAMAGTSWTSKVSEPGDSVNTGSGVRPHQRFDSSADAGIVIGGFDPHALQRPVGEGARGTVDGIAHEQVIAGAQRRHERGHDRRYAGRNELGPSRAAKIASRPMTKPRASGCRGGRRCNAGRRSSGSPRRDRGQSSRERAAD